MSTNRIDGIRLKIERAKKHIRDLDVAVRAFCDSEPYTLGIKEKPEIEHVALYVSSINPTPDDLSPVIGDVLHNLRSSLDHLAWQLVEAGGGTPNKDTYFPICKSPQQYASAVGKGEIDKMPVAAKKVLLAVQPHSSGDDTLWHIHELDRIDKHRLLLTVATGINSWNVVIRPDWTVGWGEPSILLECGYEIVNIPTSTYHGTGHKNFKLGLGIAFGQSEVVAGKPVLETLQGMTDLVDAIINAFEPYLS